MLRDDYKLLVAFQSMVIGSLKSRTIGQRIPISSSLRNQHPSMEEIVTVIRNFGDASNSRCNQKKVTGNLQQHMGKQSLWWSQFRRICINSYPVRSWQVKQFLLCLIFPFPATSLQHLHFLAFTLLFFMLMIKNDHFCFSFHNFIYKTVTSFNFFQNPFKYV